MTNVVAAEREINSKLSAKYFLTIYNLNIINIGYATCIRSTQKSKLSHLTGTAGQCAYWNQGLLTDT